MLKQRKSGVLMPVFSLPSRFGIGDFGPGAYSFCDFLKASGQSVWQILPLTITDRSRGNSPYSSISAFAGNHLYISPWLLFQEGLLRREHIEKIPSFREQKVDYGQVEKYRSSLCREAFENSRKKGYPEDFTIFCEKNSYWLDDFVLFSALKKALKGKPWHEWPEDLMNREKDSIESASDKLEDEMDCLRFVQYHFYKQWTSLHSYCMERNIMILGDIPIYVDHDSADVWSRRKYFQLDRYGHPSAVAGVPPDYFSSKGQRWGNPLFRWDELARDGFSWWLSRIGHWAGICDILRIDHFRGFLSYWSIPQNEATAVKGHWETAPSDLFLDTLEKAFPHLCMVAENLGVITSDVDHAMEKRNLPGMLVLQFAFDGNMRSNPYLPHNHKANNIVYTGTHDNNTSRGWFDEEATDEQKKILALYTDSSINAENVSWQLIRMAMASVSKICIVPMQDLLALDSSARINRPSMVKGNWEWRVDPSYQGKTLEKKLYDITSFFGRVQ